MLRAPTTPGLVNSPTDGLAYLTPIASHATRSSSFATMRRMGTHAAALSLPPQVEATLDAFVTGVRQRFGARLAAIRLFGSYVHGEATPESDVDCLVLLDRVDRADDRAITDLAADLTWQLSGVVVSPMIMSVDEFEGWKATERRTPLEIEREGVPL